VTAPVAGAALPLLDIRDVAKRYGRVAALAGVSLEIGQGEFVALLGPSGCGKTTLLRCIAGFVAPDSGMIAIDGIDVTALPPHRRPLNTVFQNYALFPHMTVAENVGYGPARAPRSPARSTQRWRWSGSTGSRRAGRTSFPVASSSASPWRAR
jgi:spermidine/putrescine transport system ATP-binding protein